MYSVSILNDCVRSGSLGITDQFCGCIPEMGCANNIIATQFPTLPPLLPLLMTAAGLRKKSVVPGSSSLEQKLRQATGAPELFGQSDVVVKHVLEVSEVEVEGEGVGVDG